MASSFPRRFPCLLLPHSPASSLHFLSPSLLLTPTPPISAPTSLEEGRGSRCDLSSAVTWRVGVVNGGDVACGGRLGR